MENSKTPSLETIKIRLREQLRLYRDSPQLTVTYIDLAHLVEDLLEILEDKKINGFKE